MGARLADTPHECTHLITQHVARTEKFLSCVSVAQYILTPDWITESIAQGRLVDETPYILRDSDAEKQYQFRLTTSLEKARKGKLMEGKEVYVTPKTHPSKETVKQIVECAGGKVQFWFCLWSGIYDWRCAHNDDSQFRIEHLCDLSIFLL